MIGQFTLHFEEGLVLMGIGMGTVFSFLCILVYSMGLMSKIVGYLNNIFPEEIKIVEKAGKKSNVSEDEAIAVAIAAAKVRG